MGAMRELDSATGAKEKHAKVENIICVGCQRCFTEQKCYCLNGTFLLLPLGFPVMEKQQVLFVLSSFLLKVCLHHQAHLEYKR